ncbi:hypothetical protein OPV22_017646 [Ensete ventricosum]|uniref:RRM domain-containing protein n=1 Tax=Ensete ventricosum TaxID=4639 RepID=A0AAV8QTN0_ENSVE|nr:hypothetical protein OPV22_017646 [Ensete ventricosum]
MGDTAAAAATLHPDEMNAAAAPTSIHRPPFPTLYIGDLHPAVTDAELIYAFTPFGTVASARVCRDRASGTPLGYAYLNFLSFSDADKALKAMNHSLLHGRPMRIMWSQRNPISRKNGIGNLFVKNLEITVSGAMLEDLFAVYGTVESCKVAIDGSGRSRGFGFVQMDSEEAAQLAITALNGVILPGSSKKLCVTKFVKKSERQALPEVPRGTNLYIKNLDWDITDDVLRQRFSAYGNISSAVVMKDRDGKSRGFGFVDFKSPEDAKNALELNGSDLGSKSLYVGYAQKRSERDKLLRLRFAGRHEHKFTKIQGSTVYVKNLEKSVNNAALRKLFSECGLVLWTKVIYDKTGLSRGFGFVCFSSAEEANEAVQRFNGNMSYGRRLYVTIAQNKVDRQKTLQLQFANPVQHAISHDSIPAPYHVPNYEWFQNQLHINPVYLYQQNGMVPFLGTQAYTSSAPTIPYQWRQLGHKSYSSANKLTQPSQTSNTSFFSQFFYPVPKMYPLPSAQYMEINGNGQYINVNDGSYSSRGAWKTSYYNDRSIINQ